MDKDSADQVVDIAQRVVASGAISANGHGNVSVRVPGAREMYFTAGPSLRSYPVSAVVRVGLGPAVLHPLNQLVTGWSCAAGGSPRRDVRRARSRG